MERVCEENLRGFAALSAWRCAVQMLFKARLETAATLFALFMALVDAKQLKASQGSLLQMQHLSWVHAIPLCHTEWLAEKIGDA
jgi:hypothetical protein